MIWLTGDTHGHFERIEAFCRERQTTRDDLLVILGDSGFNFGGGERDLALKTQAARWYCGHFHTDKTVGRLQILFREIVELEGVECR